MIGAGPLLSAEQLEIAEWIAERYLAPLFSAIALFLPPGTVTGPRKDASAVERVIPEPPAGQPRLSVALSAAELRRLIDEWPQSKASRPANLLERLSDGAVDAAEAARVLGGPVQLDGWLRSTAFARRDGGSVALKVTAEDAQAAAAALKRTAAERRQLELLRVLADGERAEGDARKASSAARADVEALIGRDVIERRISGPKSPAPADAKPAPTLTDDQRRAADAIEAALADARAARGQPRRAERRGRSFLLRGVTGSGKTEVYLSATENALAHGEGVIVLVPEIALAPQTVARFEARFPGRVAVRHSALPEREAREQWRQVYAGEKPILIGARSALFGPLVGQGRNLGLIVLDEEHEWTYKQSEPHPRYHARAVALEMAAALGAVVVLGSATPDVVSMWEARSGRHKLLELPARVESGSDGRADGGSAACGRDR